MTEPDELESLHTKMDELNDRLVALLHERAELVRTIGRKKIEAGLPPIDPAHELRMLQELTASTPDDGFDRVALQQILDVVLEQSRALLAKADA